ncbi:response regulator [Massilia antarctica]|uniref:response regulator n=1 Tax=Massilia antarctica TaxID=2765360 RepID=UPI0006BB8B3F|nr:response regulator transcription factor [Massilia sp. H27-R4]MCY0911246.1 response regulator transcription factor [Massilia sp. H27-R4]CUI05159.1 two component transcriptional regulator, LuxR family [Janthinobacterium sp. CG23_2]CUU28945.1 two component transcriptional regulator, LuxR family [Janthinobacterium sp. CG23_2]
MNPETTPIRVLVCDDHPMMREGIAAVIASQSDMCLAGEAGDGREAVAQYRALQPDVALIDIQMPDMNGIEAIQAIRAEFAQARIAVLTTYRGDARALQAIRSGAQAYLLKSALRKELTEAIRALAAGKRYFPAEIAAELANHLGQECLTPREVQVLQLIARGHSNKQVAGELALSEDTVKGHLSNIMDKLGANNRTHAVTIGIGRGFIGL